LKKDFGHSLLLLLLLTGGNTEGGAWDVGRMGGGRKNVGMKW